ncbi:unnamed protein product [Tetraodon nigroviridis]|uniref:(spotted green pufferfish) hypothetical protein n=1 Tax=Tetraodon nigroviridis TaxID=99883 RepID=Q4TDY4_TETNG|nr:unnamed protein product [Tetraodon nigroviridis]
MAFLLAWAGPRRQLSAAPLGGPTAGVIEPVSQLVPGLRRAWRRPTWAARAPGGGTEVAAGAAPLRRSSGSLEDLEMVG